MIQALLVSNILCLFISTEVSQQHTKGGPQRTPLGILRVKAEITVKGQGTKLNISYLSHSLCYPASCECKGVSLLRSLYANFPSETGHLAKAKVNNLEK